MMCEIANKTLTGIPTEPMAVLTDGAAWYVIISGVICFVIFFFLLVKFFDWKDNIDDLIEESKKKKR